MVCREKNLAKKIVSKYKIEKTKKLFYEVHSVKRLLDGVCAVTFWGDWQVMGLPKLMPPTLCEHLQAVVPSITHSTTYCRRTAPPAAVALQGPER